MSEGLHRCWPGWWVDYGQLSEKVALVHGLDDFSVDLYLYLSFLDDEEHAGWSALLDDILPYGCFI